MTDYSLLLCPASSTYRIIQKGAKLLPLWPKKVDFGAVLASVRCSKPYFEDNEPQEFKGLIWGIDIPLIVGEGDKCVAVIGEDPRRSKKTRNGVGSGWGTPYGVHSDDIIGRPNMKAYRAAIDSVLGSGHSVYLTDVSKVYVVRDKTHPKLKDLSYFDPTTVFDEVSELSIKKIVTFGRVAGLLDYESRVPGSRVLRLPHPSPQAYKSWKTLPVEDNELLEDAKRECKTEKLTTEVKSSFIGKKVSKFLEHR